MKTGKMAPDFHIIELGHLRHPEIGPLGEFRDEEQQYF
jgi:hypothetical protein